MKSNSLSISKTNRLPFTVIILATFLITIYLYFFSAESLIELFNLSEAENREIIGYNLQHISFFILFGIIPFLITLGIKDKNKYESFGLQLGDYKFGLKALSIGLLLAAVVGYLGSFDESVRSEYPLAKSLLTDQSQLITYHLIYIFFYYTAWEFFFRGFMLQSMKPSTGILLSIAIQTMASTLEHVGKPAPEILGAIPAGILFGWIAYRSRSIIYVLLIHAALGVFTDLFIIYGK